MRTCIQACHEAAVQRYVAWSLGYEFPELTAFFVRLEDLIVKVRARVRARAWV